MEGIWRQRTRTAQVRFLCRLRAVGFKNTQQCEDESNLFVVTKITDNINFYCTGIGDLGPSATDL
jgi:hypothetical protein